MPFVHGITVTEINTGARTLTAVSTAILGLVATAADANAATFPLNRPALITDVETAIGQAGTDGTLAKALRAIADQSRPIIVVVRVEEGDTEAETTANVIGTTDANGQKTGIQALLAAQAQLRVKPKILGAPGLETQAVANALIVAAQKLRAFPYARAIGETHTAAALYREQFGAREMMLLWPDPIAFDTAAAANAATYVAATAMGARARIDQETGPHKTLSNVALNGIVGLSKDISWDVEDQSSEAAILNQAPVTALVATDVGYRFWGNRTTSDDELFAFESTVRVAQLLADTVVNGMLWAIDKPLTPALAKDIVETINGFFNQLKASGVVLGANAWFDEANNSIANLKAGKLRIDYDYTVPPPLEDLGFNQRITDSYFADFSSLLTQAV